MHETMRVRGERTVLAPADQVVALALDPGRFTSWNRHMEIRALDGSLEAAGSTFDTTLTLLGLQFAGKVTVMGSEKGRALHLRVACSEYGGTSDWHYRFVAAGGSTRCSLDIACEESGTLVMLDRTFGRPALQRALTRVAEDVLEHLGAVAERGALQPA